MNVSSVQLVSNGWIRGGLWPTAPTKLLQGRFLMGAQHRLEREAYHEAAHAVSVTLFSVSCYLGH